METVRRKCSDKPATELFIVDGSPAAALAVGAHRPSQESTYVLCRFANEGCADFKQRVLKRAARIQSRECIGSLCYVVGSRSLESASSVQLLEELLPLLDAGANVTLATPRRHGRAVFGWIDELLGKGDADVSMGVRFYADTTSEAQAALAQVTPAPVRRIPAPSTLEAHAASALESARQCA